MRRPVSTRGGEEALEAAVVVGVVGGVVVPGAPEDAQPGAAEDADGVGVVAAALAGAVVDVGGPGVPVAVASARTPMWVLRRLSQAQRKLTAWCLPDCLVTGAWPASAASVSVVG